MFSFLGSTYLKKTAMSGLSFVGQFFFIILQMLNRLYLLYTVLMRRIQ